MGRYRIPGATTNISDNFQDHLNRGSLGGDDFTDSRGTEMHAIQGGTVIAVDNAPTGSGGRMVTVLGDDGNRFEELHATWIDAGRGSRVEWGGHLGVSGGSGFGSDYYYGAHIHVHGINPSGYRFSVVPYIDFNNPTSPAGVGGTTPIPTFHQIIGDSMFCMNRTKDNVIAVGDESHWQEIGYGAGSPAWLVAACIALANTLPAVPYSDAGWNGRSNDPGTLTLKRPVFIIDTKNQKLIPIDPPVSGGSGGDSAAAIAQAVEDKLRDEFKSIIDKIGSQAYTTQPVPAK